MLTPLKYDLEVAIEALKKENLQLINIIGNRIASNSIILEKYDTIFIGFFIKEISSDCRACKFWGKKNFDEGLKAGLRFIERIKPLINEELNIKLIWNEYIQFEEQIYRYIISNTERDIYTKDFDFCEKTRLILMKMLINNRKYLLNRNNNLIKGIASEMSRVLNEYGYPEKGLAFYLLMKIFYQYYEYLILDYSNVDDAEKEDKKLFINSLITKIEVAFKEDNIDEFYKKVNAIISELGKEWRNLYIIYGDIAHSVEEKRLELPFEAKKEIEDIIIEGLKAEVEKK